MSKGAQRYKLASQDIACECFDGEYVVINLHSGQYFSVCESATPFLDGLISGLDPDEMINHMAGDVEGRAADVRTFFEDLVARGLFVKDQSALPEAPTPAWIARAANYKGPLTMEVFNDLTDLLISDPIHDIDPMRGWPAVKDGD